MKTYSPNRACNECKNFVIGCMLRLFARSKRGATTFAVEVCGTGSKEASD